MKETQPHLLASKHLSETNHATIARFVNSAIRILWSNEGEEKILLLVTDSAAYMLKAGRDLKVFYPNMLHVTCLVHGLNRLVEEVRLQFPAVNKLISTVKKVFLKAPLCLQSYKQQFQNLPLPPQPIITRWGTWLQAASFYAVHLDKIKDIIESFNEKEASSIKTAKEALQFEYLRQNLTFTQTHFHELPETMKQLETVGLPLFHSTDLVTAVIENVKDIPGDCGQKINHKLQAILQRNSNYNILSKIIDILKGANVEGPQEIPAQYWCKFKYATITSCDVERSFSAYKLILTDKRHNFTTDNLEETIVTYRNLNYNK